MRVVVTGGSGQLGSLVLGRLIDDRKIKRVVSIDLVPPRIASAKLSYVLEDVRSPDLTRHMEGCDALVHLAFVVMQHMPRPLMDDVNVGGSRNVFLAALRAGITQFGYASSVAAYGVVPGHPVPIVEETPRRYQPDFAYAAHKFEVEAFLDQFEKDHPAIAVARFRPSVLIGGRMEHLLGWALARRVFVDVGAPPMPIVADEDVADAIMLGLRKRAHGAWNLSADEPLSAPEMARATGARVVKAPDLLPEGLALLMPWVAKAGVPQPIDPFWLACAHVAMAPTSERAKRELGWSPKYPTAKHVLEHYATEGRRRTDPRLSVFFRMLGLGSSRRMPREGATIQMVVHLELTGADGGDWTIALDRGKVRVTAGVPRPPTATIRMDAAFFRAMLAGRADPGTAQVTGRVRIIGEQTASFVLGGIVAGFRKMAQEPGLRGAGPRAFARFLAHGEPT